MCRVDELHDEQHDHEHGVSRSQREAEQQRWHDTEGRTHQRNGRDEPGEDAEEHGVTLLTAATYDLWVVEWGDLISAAESRYAFSREQLDLELKQDDAVARVRALHKELLAEESAA